MLAEREIEGRLVWKAVDRRDGKLKTHRCYFIDKDSRKEAVKAVSRQTYDYHEERAEEDPNDSDRLTYRRIQ